MTSRREVKRLPREDVRRGELASGGWQEQLHTVTVNGIIIIIGVVKRE